MGPKKPVANSAASDKGLNNDGPENEKDDGLDVGKMPVSNLDIACREPQRAKFETGVHAAQFPSIFTEPRVTAKIQILCT